MEVDREARLANRARLRELVRARGGEVVVFSGHDAAELAALRRERAGTAADGSARGGCAWAGRPTA
jgi:hypothetical protein